MKQSEAVEIVTIIAEYYPGWLTRMDAEEKARTLVAWAGELIDVGNFEEVSKAVHEYLRQSPGDWPPGIFKIRAFIIPRVRSMFIHNQPLLPRPERTEEELEERKNIASAGADKARQLIKQSLVVEEDHDEPVLKIESSDDLEIETVTADLNEAEIVRLSNKYGQEKVKEFLSVDDGD